MITTIDGTPVLPLGLAGYSDQSDQCVTMALDADGRVYVLKRRIRLTSDSAFLVIDEFSVDGGPFRRLGDASCIRTN